MEYSPDSESLTGGGSSKNKSSVKKRGSEQASSGKNSQSGSAQGNEAKFQFQTEGNLNEEKKKQQFKEINKEKKESNFYFVKNFINNNFNNVNDLKSSTNSQNTIGNVYLIYE